MQWRRVLIVAALLTGLGLSWSLAKNQIRMLWVTDKYRPEQTVVLDDSPGLPVAVREGEKPAHELRLAVAPIVSMERSYSMYLPLADYLSYRLGRPSKAIYGRSSAEVNEMVRRGTCDLAFMGTYAFVQGRRDFGMKVLVVPVTHEGTRYRSLILAATASRASDLEDLKGKRFAFSEDFSTGGWLYPTTWLKQRGFDPQRFFSALIPTGSHDRAVEAVATGLADVAAVNDFVYEQLVERDPAIGKAVKIIQTSPWFDAPPVVVPGNLKPALEEDLRRCLLDMNRNPRGRDILAGLGVERFTIPGPDLYQNVESMAAYLRIQK